jgi:uncharacterized protein (DUF2147 family)
MLACKNIQLNTLFMRRNGIAICILMMIAISPAIISAQSITGLWQTVSEDGVAKSEVRIWKSGDEYMGRVAEIYRKDKRDARCTECDRDDPRYNEKVLGMTIIKGLEKTGENMWENGTILDPQNGNVYKCKMRINDDGDLVVRGFVGISLVGRSQTWKRVE